MSYTTINGLFQGICDAIRSKEGSTSLINHQDIPTRITALANNNKSFAYGSFTPSASIGVVWNQYTNSSYKIAHGMPTTPNFCMVWCNEKAITTYVGNECLGAWKFPNVNSSYYKRVYNTSGASNTDSVISTNIGGCVLDATNISIGVGTTTYITAGITYYWVAGVV